MALSLVRRAAAFTALAAIMLVPTACSDSTAPEPDDPAPGGGSGTPASVVIQPGALLLTASGGTMQLEATAYDAAGAPVQTEITWRSSDPGTVSVSAGGLAAAIAERGSARITAVARGVESAPALAIVARPASGVVLVPDAQILSDPTAIDADAEYGPGWRYRIRVNEVDVEAGQLVIGTGGRSLAGRVVGTIAQGTEVELTVELVPLNVLFADLQFDETLALVDMETGTGGSSWRAPEPQRRTLGFRAADAEFTLGQFACTSSAGVPDLDLPSPTLKIDPDLSLALGYANGLEKYAVVGSITADFGYKPVFKATFEGKIGCETVVRTVTLPVGGFLAWFFGIQVPLGVAFELDGKLEIAEVGFDVTAHAEATAELGLLCPAAGGACTALTSFDAERDFGFEFIAPDPTEQFKLELGAKGFVFARPSVGSKFSAKTQFAFLEATAGLEQSVDLATTTRQVKESDYASGFKLEGQIDVGPGKDLTNALDKLGDLLGVDLDLDLTLVDIDETLAESPKGTFTITPGNVEPGNDMALGEMATFTVELDPVTYLGIESVDKVEIFWKKDDGAGGFTLDAGRPGCTDISGSAGQAKFECQTDFMEEHAGEQTFYAFVHARLFGVPLPIPIELANDAQATVRVGDAPGGPVGLVESRVTLEARSSVGKGFLQDSDEQGEDIDGFETYEGSFSSSASLLEYGTASSSATAAYEIQTDPGSGAITRIQGEATATMQGSGVEDEGILVAGNAHPLIRFVVNTPTAFALTGSLSATPSVSASASHSEKAQSTLSLGRTAEDHPYPTLEVIFAFDARDDGAVDVSGTLQPGSYTLSARSSASWQKPVACSPCGVEANASHTFALTMEPAP